jgi:NADH-quinone oxidoreductase subunit M
MILPWLVVIPLAGALLSGAAGLLRPSLARWIACAAMAAELALAATLWPGAAGGRHGDVVCRHANESCMSAHGADMAPGHERWLADFTVPWIPSLGISFHLAIDGLSLLMVLLTAVLGLISVVISWNEIRHRVGLFHLNLLLVLAGIVGVFLAMDLFLFYFFWELMLVPMYFLIDLWGHEDRHRAAVKFFIFTQLGGLAMLLSILALYFIHAGATGWYTFDYFLLLGTRLEGRAGMLVMLGFFLGFAVKLPVVPLHTWLPDAHTQAPTAGSVILAGLLLKTGAYGLLRFVLPLFPHQAAQIAPLAMTLGVAGILYGAALAFAQSDLKRLIAYTSVSHLGFVLLGAFANNTLALEGAVMQMLCHGLSTGALFILAGLLQERLGTREMDRMGGMWAATPKLAAAGMFFAMASLGLPGLGNFVGEFLILLGAYKVNIALTVLATAGFVAATVYSLWMVQRVFHGPLKTEKPILDLRAHEAIVLAAMIIGLVALGLYPQPVLDVTAKYLINIKPTEKESMSVLVDAYQPAAVESGGSRRLTPAPSVHHVFVNLLHQVDKTVLSDRLARGAYDGSPTRSEAQGGESNPIESKVPWATDSIAQRAQDQQPAIARKEGVAMAACLGYVDRVGVTNRLSSAVDAEGRR